MNMRQFFKENDIVSAEIHCNHTFDQFNCLALNADKTINLHTRSLKYGKLENGFLKIVNHKLIKR